MSISYSDVRRAYPGIKGSQISKTAGIRPYKLDNLYRFAYDDMKGGEVVGNKIGGLAATTTDGNQLCFQTPRGIGVDKLNIDTQATNPLPVLNSLGLDISSPSQTSAKGAEYIFGGITNPALGFVVGTDAFFMRAKVKIHDVSGTDLWIGFRKNTAFVANVSAWGTAVPVATYGDLASVFFDGTASTAAGTTKTQTSLNGATAVTTDLSLATADDDVNLVEIRVDGGGNVTYLINGALSSAAAAFQFTAGITVVPMIAFLNTADVGDGVYLSQFECGLVAGNVRAG